MRFGGVGEAAFDAVPLVSGGALDALLEYSPPQPALNLSASWRDASTLVLTVLAAEGDSEGDAESGSGSGAVAPAADAASGATSSTIRLGEFRVSTRAAAALRDADQASVRTVVTSPPLTGSCGRPPQIAGFTASDPDDADAVCAAGDTLTLTFDRPTDQPPAATRVEVDRLLEFSQVHALGHPPPAPSFDCTACCWLPPIATDGL